MITYNVLIERFKAFADAHYFIRSFSHGEPTDLDLDKLQEYPLFHVTYLGAAYENGTKVYNVDIYIIDLSPVTGNSQQQAKEVVSDSEQCAEDVIADITAGWIVFDMEFVVRSASVLPIVHKDKNVNCGAVLSLQMEVAYDSSACYAPLDGVNPATGENTYQRRGILRMRTLNGVVDVPSVRQINVTNGTLTDNGEGVVTLSITGAVALVDSVNGQTGDVVLDADDISDDTTTHKFTTTGDIAKLAGIEPGAQVNDVTSVNGEIGDVVIIDLFEIVKNVGATTLPKGTPVHVVGNAGNEAEVIAADAATNYPAQFILDVTLAAGASGKAIAAGFINNVDVPNASIYTPGQELWLGHSGGWVTTKPTGANAIQKLGVILHVNTGGNKISGVIYGMGNNEDLPNLPNGKIWLGNGSGVPAETTLNTDNVPQGATNLYHIPTDLTNTPTSTLVAVNSSTGADTNLPAATSSLAGVMTAADKFKLDGIAAGAEVNVQANWTETNTASDAFILNKPAVVSSVTGTSPISVSGTTTRNVSISAATTSVAGSMSAADKTKLDGIQTGAQVNANAFGVVEIFGSPNVVANSPSGTLTLVAGANITLTGNATNDSVTIAATGSTGVSSVTGTAPISVVGTTTPNVSISAATPSAAGSMSAADKTKLDGIAAGAEVNVNADWNATSGDAQILNKPTLAAVATSGLYSDLTGVPERFFTPKNVVASTYTLVGSDKGYYIRIKSSVKHDLIIPASTFQTGDEILVEQADVGKVEFLPASGVTLRNTSQFKNISFGIYAVIGLKMVAANEWVITGEREAI